MNGAQHYLAAEKALAEAEAVPREDRDHFDRLIALAERHTRLAHVAAIAPMPQISGHDWRGRDAHEATLHAWRNAIHGPAVG